MNTTPIDEKETAKEILKKVRHIDLSLRRKVNTLFSGQYHSTFKGEGMVFSDFREYIAGDDIRSISWNLTAKIGRPYIKTFEVERESPVILVADISGSLDFGTGDYSKKEALTLLLGLIAFCAQKNRDPVGLLLFSDKVECYIPPRRDPRQAFHILIEVCRRRESSFKKTNLRPAVESLEKTLKRRSRIFFFSDFLFSETFENSLKRLSHRHELVSLMITDSFMEKAFPSLGLVDMEDLETGETITLDTSSHLFKTHWKKTKEQKEREQNKIFTRSGIKRVLIDTQKDIYRPVIDFFRQKQLSRLKSYG